MPDAHPACLWNIDEAAAYLRLPRSAVYKMTAPKASTRIPHVRISGRLRFRRADLDRWVDLLTVSNLDRMAKARRLARKEPYGVDT